MIQALCQPIGLRKELCLPRTTGPLLTFLAPGLWYLTSSCTVTSECGLREEGLSGSEHRPTSVPVTPARLYPAYAAHAPRATAQVLGNTVQTPRGPYSMPPPFVWTLCSPPSWLMASSSDRWEHSSLGQSQPVTFSYKDWLGTPKSGAGGQLQGPTSPSPDHSKKSEMLW